MKPNTLFQILGMATLSLAIFVTSSNIASAVADTTAPSISIVSPSLTNNTYTTNQATLPVSALAVKITDVGGIATPTVRWTNSANGTAGNLKPSIYGWTLNAPIPLALGTNIVALRANDMTGNAGTKNFTITRTDSTSTPPVANKCVTEPWNITDGGYYAGTDIKGRTCPCLYYSSNRKSKIMNLPIGCGPLPVMGTLVPPYTGPEEDLSEYLRPLASNRIIGNHESATCSVITGWTCDKMSLASTTIVEVYDGALESGGIRIATGVANLNRESAVGGKCSGYFGPQYPKHGFSIVTPDSIKTGTSKNIHIYARYAFGTQARLLPNSPKAITCAPSNIATSTYSLSTTSTANPSGIVENDRVRIVTPTKRAVRSVASSTASVLGWQLNNATGTIVSGPTRMSVYNSPYDWFNINFDTGADGWISAFKIGTNNQITARIIEKISSSTSSSSSSIVTSTPITTEKCIGYPLNRKAIADYGFTERREIHPGQVFTFCATVPRQAKTLTFGVAQERLDDPCISSHIRVRQIGNAGWVKTVSGTGSERLIIGDTGISRFGGTQIGPEMLAAGEYEMKVTGGEYIDELCKKAFRIYWKAYY